VIKGSFLYEIMMKPRMYFHQPPILEYIPNKCPNPFKKVKVARAVLFYKKPCVKYIKENGLRETLKLKNTVSNKHNLSGKWGLITITFQLKVTTN
jgi:hypothetical protein